MGLCKSKPNKKENFTGTTVVNFIVDDECNDNLEGCKHDVILIYNRGRNDKSKLSNKSIYNLYKAFGKEIPNHFQKIEN